MAAIVLLISLPVALLEAWTGSLVAYFFVVCCIFAGIGFAQAAFTGRWFNSVDRSAITRTPLIDVIRVGTLEFDHTANFCSHKSGAIPTDVRA